MNDATKDLAEEVAEATIRRTFTMLGVDIDDADEIRHFQANMAWVYRFRRLSERVGSAIILTVVTAATGGIVTLIWDSIGKKGGH